MSILWQQRGTDRWLTDFRRLPDTSRIHSRALRGFWQVAPYQTRDFEGAMLLANPGQEAPEIRIPLPVTGRYAIAVGLVENYSDRLLLKLERDRFFTKLFHSPVTPTCNGIEECWWRDVDLVAGDALVFQQDHAMRKRAGVGFIHLYPAPPSTRPQIPLLATVDGMPGNNGPLALDDMLAEELQFAETHVTAICHGTDICGAAQYLTRLPEHQYAFHRAAEEVHPDNEYYPWSIEQLLRYEREGRCPLRDSIRAAHEIGRPLYAYHRMGILRLYAPYRSIFPNPFFDNHPEWRCVDFDGTPIARLSIAFPAVRRYFLEHFRETIEYGADGVCLVFARGWPLVLCETPVADELRRRTGKDRREVGPDDPDLIQVRVDIVHSFLREIRDTVETAAGGRDVRVVAIVLAKPEDNRWYGMDCARWCREGLVDTLVPYPYGKTAERRPIQISDWLPVVRGTNTQLCPILNRTTDEPTGRFETPKEMLDRAERWLAEGVHGFTFWDLDHHIGSPDFRAFAHFLGSAEGRTRLRRQIERGPIRYELKTLDGLTVDRYHPGWNV